MVAPLKGVAQAATLRMGRNVLCRSQRWYPVRSFWRRYDFLWQWDSHTLRLSYRGACVVGQEICRRSYATRPQLPPKPLEKTSSSLSPKAPIRMSADTARSSSDILSRTRRILAILAGAGLLVGFVGPSWTSQGGLTDGGQTIQAKWKHFRNKMSEFGLRIDRALENASAFLQERVLDVYFPSHPAPLLPDAEDLKHPENFPTLVVDLDKVLLRMEHDRVHGWRPLLRPGAEHFFKELVYHYEIVVWSDDSFPVAQDICVRWGLPVVGALHRDNCKRKNGHYVKDLSRLGRRLERVVILDHDPHAFALQPENGLLIREFDGNPADTELYTATEFLKAAALGPTSDLREVLAQYGPRDAGYLYRWAAHRNELEKKTETRRQLGSRIFGQRLNAGLGHSGGLRL